MRIALLLATTALLAGCASRPTPVALAPIVPPPAIVAAAPAPPAGAAPNLTLPTRLGDGGWATPNRGISNAAATWHLRAALNVATLSCRDALEPQTVASYNTLLAAKRAELAQADERLRAEYRAGFGPAWQDAHDDAMTRVYNFFALPPVQAAFCAEARTVLAEVAAAPPEAFAAMAPAALARIEAPFTAFFDAYERYRLDRATWLAARTATAPRLEVSAAVLSAGVGVAAPR